MLPTTQSITRTEEEALFARADELGCAPILVPVIERLNKIIELLTEQKTARAEQGRDEDE